MGPMMPSPSPQESKTVTVEVDKRLALGFLRGEAASKRHLQMQVRAALSHPKEDR